MGLIIIGLIINLIISLFVCNWASKLRLNSVNVFFISFLLSPIIALFYILIFKDNEQMKVNEKVEEKEVEEIDYESYKYLVIVISIILFVGIALIHK